MTFLAKSLSTFLKGAPAAAIVEVREAKGSTPREKGAWMLVAPDAIFGTIGGGQLEFLAIAKARELIAENVASGALDIPLGPEIGQCCGGHVALDIRIAGSDDRTELLKRAGEEDAGRPHVYLFGGGHVGHALAAALSLLPVRTIVVETRAEALEGMPEEVERRLTAVPEEAVREAPAGAAFVVLTHDHALDFLIVAEALRRDDAAYIGMIGSKTKKATFKSWYLKNGGEEARLPRLVTPIGGEEVRDKRPTVIAAMTAAEVMRAVASHEA
ncbi:xanthine dehydrogenase accessory protein XdhC [Chelativorans salis]|uniref:Xanthine dehydrogenase accessory protein XdhC n=1 Tax=Chelativorans salis TaxID=2978478 RepID=A0ABT2LT87_9HYPH|nr:xanthine dehydrogenase accessory protein XdhC [Chelativorans sp. EGI FJ00035]MCT7377753.1 xanthine dehydrogenase accessory protein XdhC [Chelativorans sp. EGI FJ00035]